VRVVRTAIPGDIRWLRAMLAAFITEHQARFPDAYPRFDPESAAAHYAAEWDERLQSDPSCNVWLATDRDVRGFLAGEVWTRAVGEPPATFFVEWLYVVPEHRKTGIARALFRDGLIPYCRRHGITVAEARVVPSDTQWTERGYVTTALSIMRSIDALAADVAERPS